MLSSNLVRLGGLAALLGAVLQAIRATLEVLNVGSPTGDYPPSEAATTWSYTAVNGLGSLAFALLLVGLVGLYAGQAEAVGRLGLVGFLGASVGTALQLGMRWENVFFISSVAGVAPELLDNPTPGAPLAGLLLSSGLYTLGWFLFAVATFRARVYPHAAATLLVVGVLLSLPDPFWLVEAIIRCVAVVWLGFALLTERVASSEEPAPSWDLGRWGALAAPLAGAAWIAVGLIRALVSPSDYLIESMTGIALICTLGGLAVLHARQRASYGRLGKAGFFLAFAGCALIALLLAQVVGLGLTNWGRAFGLPIVLGILGMLVGFVLLGIATLRARELPRWSGLLLVLPIVYLPLAGALGAVLRRALGDPEWMAVGLIWLTLGLVWLALGYALREQRSPTAPASERSVQNEEHPSNLLPRADQS